MENDKIIDFVNFISMHCYDARMMPELSIVKAFNEVCDDVKYNESDVSLYDVFERISGGKNELAVFLYRLGRIFELNREGLEEALLSHYKRMIHFLLKKLCGCEIYFNTSIGVGFCVVHGEGLIIGSRNVIGSGFKIFQGCTIGHRQIGYGHGCVIGDNVCVYANSTILDCKIGDNVIVGAHTLVLDNVPNDSIIYNKYEKSIISNRYKG